MASYGSVGMFHIVGITPEARTEAEAFGGIQPVERFAVNPGDLEGVYRGFRADSAKPDLVVFSAPQLSLHEIAELTSLFDGKTVNPSTRVYVTTSSMVKAEADRLGYAREIEKSGVYLLTGVCFYLMAPHELAERFGYRTLVTDSAKLANIVAGYGYDPLFRPTDVCVQAAVTGEIPW
jgi:predicted aconitase